MSEERDSPFAKWNLGRGQEQEREWVGLSWNPRGGCDWWKSLSWVEVRVELVLNSRDKNQKLMNY